MDPFTLGIVAVGATGGTLALIGLLEKLGISINQASVNFLLESTKYGALLWLLKRITEVFL